MKLNPGYSKPRKTDSLNWTLRYLTLNASESMRWEAGSRFRNYADRWIASKSADVWEF